jgi:hypothetical protein
MRSCFVLPQESGVPKLLGLVALRGVGALHCRDSAFASGSARLVWMTRVRSGGQGEQNTILTTDYKV